MRYLYFILVLMLIPVVSVFAYLDPGTGSMIVSAIIGALATVAYIFKGWFFKITRIFRKKDSQEQAEDIVE